MNNHHIIEHAAELFHLIREIEEGRSSPPREVNDFPISVDPLWDKLECQEPMPRRCTRLPWDPSPLRGRKKKSETILPDSVLSKVMEPVIVHLSDRAFLEEALEDIVTGTTPDPDRFSCPEKDAWYRSLHFHGKEEWGIYIRVRSIERIGRGLARSLETHLPQLSLARLLAAPLLKLLNHEVYHHLVEGMASRLQAGAPDGPHLVYVNYKNSFYRPTFLSDDCIEEGLANGHALRAFQTAYAKHTLGQQFALHAANHFRRCIEDEVHGLPGYRLGGQFMKPDLARKGERVLLDLMMSGCGIKPHNVVQGAAGQGNIVNLLSEWRYRTPALGGLLRPLTSLTDVPVYLVVDEHY